MLVLIDSQARDHGLPWLLLPCKRSEMRFIARALMKINWDVTSEVVLEYHRTVPETTYGQSGTAPHGTVR